MDIEKGEREGGEDNLGKRYVYIPHLIPLYKMLCDKNNDNACQGSEQLVLIKSYIYPPRRHAREANSDTAVALRTANGRGRATSIRAD
ncbi:hypothetical protein EVAR_26513_1 [Eumeta japonica]|uniref:Uncharacterized protein n=1 Tax=Eumeta variegata TaxID=151549 RepID=A0A4C1V951_EUMVA|nr:hypothetical protein EVAR_26513_1 [Eumeta japonica]